MAIILVKKRMDLAKMLAPIIQSGLSVLGFGSLLAKFYCLVIDRLFDECHYKLLLNCFFVLALVKISNR